MFAVLVQLAGSVAILWGVGSVGRGSSFDPHHDGLSLKQPSLFSQVPVGLQINSSPLRCRFDTCSLPSQHTAAFHLLSFCL